MRAYSTVSLLAPDSVRDAVVSVLGDTEDWLDSVLGISPKDQIVAKRKIAFLSRIAMLATMRADLGVKDDLDDLRWP